MEVTDPEVKLLLAAEALYADLRAAKKVPAFASMGAFLAAGDALIESRKPKRRYRFTLNLRANLSEVFQVTDFGSVEDPLIPLVVAKCHSQVDAENIARLLNEEIDREDQYLKSFP